MSTKYNEALSRASAKLDKLVDIFEKCEPSEPLAREMYKAVAVVAEHLKQNDDRPAPKPAPKPRAKKKLDDGVVAFDD